MNYYKIAYYLKSGMYIYEETVSADSEREALNIFKIRYPNSTIVSINKVSDEERKNEARDFLNKYFGLSVGETRKSNKYYINYYYYGHKELYRTSIYANSSQEALDIVRGHHNNIYVESIIDANKYWSNRFRSMGKGLNAKNTYVYEFANTCDNKSLSDHFSDALRYAANDTKAMAEFSKHYTKPITNELNERIKEMNNFEIRDVQFNNPLTVVIWADGTKTFVKCHGDDIYNPAVGLSIAIAKKALGNTNKYKKTINGWIKAKELKNYEVTFTNFLGTEHVAYAFAKNKKDAIKKTKDRIKDLVKSNNESISDYAIKVKEYK